MCDQIAKIWVENKCPCHFGLPGLIAYGAPTCRPYRAQRLGLLWMPHKSPLQASKAGMCVAPDVCPISSFFIFLPPLSPTCAENALFFKLFGGFAA